MATGGDDPLARRSPVLVRWFHRYARRNLRKSFHGVRVLKGTWPGPVSGRPLIVVANHPSWWDPLVLFVAGTAAFPERRCFAPIDAAMLEKYAVFKRLGLFGIAPTGAAGAARFLRVGGRVLADPGNALFVTAEGRFTDPRRRPVRLMPGVARLASGLEEAAVVPLAVEYVFWQERYPEALLAFGPEVARSPAAEPTGGLHAALEAALARTMDRLADAAMARDASAFDEVVGGSVGVGGVYDAWRAAAAFLRGRRFDPSHEGRRP